LNDTINNNKMKLPPLFNPNHPKFVGISHLYSIYYDSYMCVLCGLYHPGIMLMGQLIESTLKEIILVHDNVNNEATFKSMILYSENFAGKQRKNSKDPLLPNVLNIILNRINNTIRNPYVHLNYTNIFQGAKIRGIRISAKDSIEGIIAHTEQILTKIKNGEIELVEIDPVIDKVFADATKRSNDPEWAIGFAYEIYPFFELLIDLYLTEKDYENYRTKHHDQLSARYETIPLVE